MTPLPDVAYVFAGAFLARRFGRINGGNSPE